MIHDGIVQPSDGSAQKIDKQKRSAGNVQENAGIVELHTDKMHYTEKRRKTSEWIWHQEVFIESYVVSLFLFFLS